MSRAPLTLDLGQVLLGDPFKVQGSSIPTDTSRIANLTHQDTGDEHYNVKLDGIALYNETLSGTEGITVILDSG